MPKPLTLPLLTALAYLHAHNLTIDRLWTERPTPGPPETHITTKPSHSGPAPDPQPPSRPSVPTCTICHKPKDDPVRATCLSVPCLKVFFGKK